MSALKTRFCEAFEIGMRMEDEWAQWFDPSLPQTLPDEYEYSPDVVIAMLDSGETYWSHPGWIQDIWRILDDWANAGKLIRLRLTAQWLLSTLPHDPIDGDLGERLYLLATGQFCEAFEGEACLWPHNSKFYLTTLNWKMAGIAQAKEQSLVKR